MNPASGLVRQSLWPAFFAFNFDEPLGATSVTTNNIAVTNDAAVATPFTVALANAGQQLRVTLARPLRPGTTYTNTLLPGLADTSSNGWQNVGGGAVTGEGVSFTLATANFLGVTPTNGATFQHGQTVPTAVSYESGIGAAFFRFLINGAQAAQVAAGATNTAAVLTMPTSGTEAVIGVVAANDAAFTEPFALAPVTVNLLPLGADTDGDGMPDAYELANNFDPFRNDAGEDPDSDGLTNLAEFTAGTNPRVADTDGDGILDGVDPNPLAANRRPVAVPTLATNADASVTISLGGSDPDGDALTTRLTALPAVGRIFTTTNGTTLGAAITNVPTVVTGTPPQLIFRALGVASTNQLRYLVDDGFTNSTEAIVTLVSTNNPAVVDVPVNVPVNTLVTVHCWTREPSL